MTEITRASFFLNYKTNTNTKLFFNKTHHEMKGSQENGAMEMTMIGLIAPYGR